MTQDSQTITTEQIAQGWIAYTGNGEPPFKKSMHGPPFQLARMHDGELCTTAVITEKLPDEIDWSGVVAYRVWAPRLPSPPVSGDVKLEWRKLDPSQLTLKGVIIGEVEECYSESRDKKYFNAFIGSGENDLMPSEYDTFDEARNALMTAVRAWLYPLTNEPVGVTISREDAIDDLRGMIIEAWCAGAKAVHDFHFPDNPDDDFREGAVDYSDSVRDELNARLSASITGEKG